MLEKSIRMDAASPAGKVARPTDPHMTVPSLRAAPVRSTAADSAPQSDVLALAAEIASQAPPIDAARVAVLRERIASGDYSINIAATALAIANALVERGDA